MIVLLYFECFDSCVDYEQVKCHLMLGVSSHVGEMIVQSAKQKEIDVLAIGRRGMSGLSRSLLQIHSNCNLIC